MSAGHYSFQTTLTISGKKRLFFIGNQSLIGVPGAINPILFNGCSSMTIRNVDIEEQEGPSDYSSVIVTTSCDVVIDNMHSSTDRLAPIAVYDGKLTITHSEFKGPPLKASRLAADDCIFLGNGPTVTTSGEITNSVVIAEPDQQAIGLPRPPDGTQFNTTIAHNTFIGGIIFCEDSAFSHVFDSNIFYNPSRVTTGSNCTYNYNLIVGSSTIGGSTNVTGDPQFKDLANKNFHLKPGSPAIDAANPTTLVTKDFDGTPRPQGPRSDIGAFEYVP